jgi:hypothetical protein
MKQNDFVEASGRNNTISAINYGRDPRDNWAWYNVLIKYRYVQMKMRQIQNYNPISAGDG